MTEKVRDAVATMGTILPDSIKEGTRDAVHVACIAVRAAGHLKAGDNVGIVMGKASMTAKKNVGIVDPFLKEELYYGKKFWLYLYPRTITGLNHHWEHPDFPNDLVTQAKDDDLVQKEIAERWLVNWCKEQGLLWEVVKSQVENHLGSDGSISGGGTCFNNYDITGEIPSEFWINMEIILGRKINLDYAPDYFSCAC